MSNRVPAEVFPPGEFIRDELEAKGWTQADLAEILKRPLKAVSEILLGKRAITPETAKGLGEAFGVDPQFWMNLESAYRLSLVSDQDGEVARRAKLYEVAPIKEMIRRQWITDADNLLDLEREVLGFFGVDTVESLSAMSVAVSPRKSTSYHVTTPPQLAWFQRAKQLASSVPVSSYKEDCFDSLIADLGRLTSSEQEASRVPGMLADYGIRFVVVEHLAKTHIDGAAFWLDEESPAVALSIRIDRIDGFWFTLFHELAHIHHKHSQRVDSEIIGENSSSLDSKEISDPERIANDFARDHLIPAREIESFIARVGPLYSKARINQFANRITIHPGIIVGQLQYRGEIKYSQGREMLVKIRDIVTRSATTDGWGNYPHLHMI